MRKIIGIGETILDIVFKNNQPEKAIPGGSVFNGLVSLSRCKVPVNFISEIGNDHVGEIIYSFMKENQMPTEYVDRFPHGKSALSLAFLDENSDANYQFYKDYPEQRLEIDFPKIEKNDLVIFGSFYALNPTLRKRIKELLDDAKQQGAIIYYDPNFRSSHSNEVIKLMPTILENFEDASIVRASDEDIYNMFGSYDIEKIYRNKIRYDSPIFLCTKGEKGIDLYTPDTKKHYDVPTITTVSTIGAGDNFNAGILYGLLQTKTSLDDLAQLPIEKWDTIIEYAILFSTNVCQSYNNYISEKLAEELKSRNTMDF